MIETLRIITEGEIEDIALENMPEGAYGFCQCANINGAALIVIALEKFNNTPYCKGILAHECFHATEYAFEIRDIKYCKSTSEIWAYNIQMLVEKFSEGSFKKSSRLKKKEVNKIIKFHVGK